MDYVEYQRLERVDADHWFYRGKRCIARYWIGKSINGLRPDDFLIDVGCGIGRFLSEWDQTLAIGIDPETSPGKSLPGRLPELPFRSDCAAIIVALDVLEHCADDRLCLEELVRVLRPGGVLCATVPALPWLWSDWDRSLHHFRRYTRRSLLAIVPPRVELIRCSYLNELALFPAFVFRQLRRLPFFGNGRRAEDIIPPAPLNSILENIFVWLTCRSRYLPPMGLSLLLVLRKI